MNRISICFTILLLFISGSLFDVKSQSIKVDPDLNEKLNSGIIIARPVIQIPVAVYESSGIAVAGPNRIWSHNDAGNTNELFCFDTTGNLVRALLILNATNIDWEDLARDDQGRIYINDAGNNENNRTDLKIHRIPDPATIVGSVVEAETINFIFEDQYNFPPPEPNRNFDIEAMLWKSDSLYLFTKNRSIPQNGMCKMYRLPANPGNYTAMLMGSVFLGFTDSEARVTSADLNLETGEVILLTSTKIVSFVNYPYNHFFEGDKTEHFFSEPIVQIEGVDFVDNERLFLIEEGSKRGGGYLYEVLWQPASSVTEIPPGGIHLFPNPFTNNLNIAKTFDGEIRFDLWDVSGNIIMQNIPAERELTLHQLSPGIYFVRLIFNNESQMRRIVKL
ncbi:MAG: T9SS type A sorting domain-containing protein [Bacteroidales bacterium]|nr:T9SS type A sorting domain-containing protein [Bacteroidales bacterium]